MNQSLKGHIKKAISQGYSINQVKDALLKQGYDAKTVEESMREFSKKSDTSRKKVMLTSLSILILIVIIVGLGYYYPKMAAYKDAEKMPSDTEIKGISEAQSYIETSFDLYKQKKYEEAIVQINKALAMNLDAGLSSAAHTRLGSSYYQLENYEKAKEEFSKAIDLNPVNDLAHTGLGWTYYQLNDYKKAKEELEKAFDINPENPATIEGLRVLNNL